MRGRESELEVEPGYQPPKPTIGAYFPSFRNLLKQRHQPGIKRVNLFI